jgi:transposase-like protein
MRHSKKTKAKVLELISQGTPVTRAATQFGVNAWTARGWLRSATPAKTIKPALLHEPVNHDLLITGLREQNSKLKQIVSELYLKSQGL